jgi:hypothetical protein
MRKAAAPEATEAATAAASRVAGTPAASSRLIASLITDRTATSRR